jgi:hypothetical protein
VLTSTDTQRATVILDYGVVVAGVPVFQVKSVKPGGSTGHVVLKVRYTEAVAYIDREGGDGPFPFTAAADTLRVNEYDPPLSTTCVQGNVDMNYAAMRFLYQDL